MEAMSHREALDIFRNNGIDVSTFNADELKQAHHKLAKQNHPDKGGDVETMKMINTAYDTLATGGFKSSPNRSQEQSREDYPQWAMAGYSGGMRNSASIHRNDYRDVNFIKKTMWEKSGQSKQQWNIIQFDGRFFRHSTTVYGSPEIFKDMAEAMLVWGSSGNPYHTRAVLVKRERTTDELLIIWADGTFYDQDPHPVTFDPDEGSYINNRRLQQELPEILDNIAERGSKLSTDQQ